MVRPWQTPETTFKENTMPVITIDTAALSREQKDRLVSGLTREASEITGIAPEKFIVLINEMERDNIGVGGRLLSDILR
jgi:4-oxalocrotonate tautomerase